MPDTGQPDSGQPVHPLDEAVRAALAGVDDPEIGRSITELEMVESVVFTGNDVHVHVLLTVSGCPMRDEIIRRVTTAVEAVPGVGNGSVSLGVMNDEQRKALATHVRGGRPEKEIPFARPGSLTRVYAVASGKGGVGKSTVTTNLAAAMAADGLTVGVLDADIYGFSVPRMLGVAGRPTQVEQMILPPQSHGIRVISIGMFTKDNGPVVWRGPMLHRALQQFLADVHWGDLDVLLLDLPPGTGDIAISVAQLLPSAEIVVVTTPQLAAHEVAERAGAIATQTHQRLAGVVENMAGLTLPDGTVLDLFGAGGGAAAAAGLTKTLGHDVPLLGSIPIDPRLREGADAGEPLVISDPQSPAAIAIRDVARALVGKPRGLSGMSLGISPTRKPPAA
jgi:ATP-binding protein involved in chromosome partitioning